MKVNSEIPLFESPQGFTDDIRRLPGLEQRYLPLHSMGQLVYHLVTFYEKHVFSAELEEIDDTVSHVIFPFTATTIKLHFLVEAARLKAEVTALLAAVMDFEDSSE